MKITLLALSAAALLAIAAAPAHANHLGNNDESFSFAAPEAQAAAETVTFAPASAEPMDANGPIDIEADQQATARPTEIAPPLPEVVVAPEQPEQPQVISPAPQNAPVRPKWEKPVNLRKRS